MSTPKPETHVIVGDHTPEPRWTRRPTYRMDMTQWGRQLTAHEYRNDMRSWEELTFAGVREFLQKQAREELAAIEGAAFHPVGDARDRQFDVIDRRSVPPVQVGDEVHCHVCSICDQFWSFGPRAQDQAPKPGETLWQCPECRVDC